MAPTGRETVFCWRGTCTRRLPGWDIWSGTQATKGGSIKDGAREGAGEVTRRSVHLVKGGVQSLMDGIRRGTEPPAGSRD